MRNHLHRLLCIALLGACTGAPAQERSAGASAARTPDPSAVASIRPIDFRARMAFLADDALRGRDTPSPELDVTAAYITSEFRSLGLEPMGDSGSYLQRYPYVTRVLHANEIALQLRTSAGALPLRYATDYYVFPGVADAAGELVYIGPVATPAPLTAALQGRVAVADWNGGGFSAASSLRTAVEQAGATGLLLVLDSTAGADAVARGASSRRASRAGSRIPALYLRRDHARTLFRAAGMADALNAAPSAPAQPQVLRGASLTLRAPADEITRTAPNVIALLRGSDPALRDSYLLISAHMDHIGVGGRDAPGDSINNGADDNASGTSAVLELAEAFASLEPRPARSILFVTVSGEEKGLLGSAYLAEHLPVAREKVVANINIDMISRNAPDTIVAIGQQYSSLGPLVQRVQAEHPELQLTVAQDRWPDERYFFRSDHYNFAKQDIPAIFFFSGPHEDYHRPSDEIDKSDFDKATRVTRLIYHLAHELANSPQVPTWVPEGLAEVRRMTR